MHLTWLAGITARWYGRTSNRFLFLMGALIAVIFFYPFAEGSDKSEYIFSGLMTVILFLALYAVIDRKHHFRIAFVLLLPAISLLWARAVFSGSPELIVGSTLTSILFFGVIIAMIVHRILTTPHINRDTIYGAVSVYLLIGLLWASMYATAAEMTPDAFSYSAGAALPGNSLTFGNILYFSFITLSTTGYGDIIPTIRITQSLAMVEAITGVIFIAVFVSRLVGIVGWQKEAGKDAQPGTDTLPDEYEPGEEYHHLPPEHPNLKIK